MKNNLLINIIFRVLFLICLVNLSYSLQAQTSLQIGTDEIPSQTVSSPIYFNYYRSYTQSIYYQSELSGVAGKRILKIAYKPYNVTTTTDQRIRVYIGHTSKTAFSSTSDWIANNTLTLVYDGKWDMQTTGSYWVDIELDTPFVYNGTDNLVIAVETPDKRNWFKSTPFYATKLSGSTNRTLYSGDDTNPINLASPKTGTPNTYTPNTIFYYKDLATGPELTLKQNTIDYSYVEVGKTAKKTISVYNTGAADLNISGIQGINSPFAVSSTLPVTIAAGSFANIEFSYTPESSGLVSQNVTFVHDGVGTGNLVLQGNSYAAGSLFESFEDSVCPPAYWRTKNNKWAIGSTANGAYLGTKYITIGTTTDTIITPKLSGVASLFVKQNSTTGQSVKVLYSSDLITWTEITPAFTLSSSYQKLEVNVTQAGYIGIAGSNIDVDLIQSETVSYPEKDILITSTTIPTLFKENTPVTFSLTLKNWGKNTETAYQVVLKDGKTNAVLKTLTTVPALASLSEANVNFEWNPLPTVKSVYFEVELAGDDDLTTNKSSIYNISVIPHKGVLTSSVKTFNFGLLRTTGESKSISYKISNTGIAALDITGFAFKSQNTAYSTDLFAAPFEPGDNLDLVMTFSPPTPGLYIDTLFVYTNGINTVDTLVLKGELYKEGDLLEDFNSGVIPASGWILKGKNWKIQTGSVAYEGTSTAYLNTSEPGDTLITPLVQAKAKDIVSFYARSWSSATDVELKVLLSTDGKHWDVAKEIKANELPNSSPYLYHDVEFPTADKYYVAFTGLREVLLDLIKGPQVHKAQHDISINTISGPVSAKVNNISNYTVTLKNYGLQAEDNYSIRLFDGNSILSEIPGPVISAGETVTATIPWIPYNTTGHTIKATVVLNGDESPANNITTNSIIVAVSAENINRIEVGTIDYTGNPFQNYAPITYNWRYSASEMIYYNTELTVATGKKITKIGFPYFNTDGNDSTTVRIWIANTSLTNLESSIINPSTMTLVYSKLHQFPKAGKDVSPSEIWFDLISPYEYNGGNIVVVMEADRIGVSGYFKGAKFYSYTTGTEKRSKYYKHDTTKIIDSSNNFGSAFQSSNDFLGAGKNPVTYFIAETSGFLVTGNVVDKTTGDPIEGATITLSSSDGLKYYTTTGVDGKFIAKIFSDGKIYDVTIAKHGYKNSTSSITLNGADVIQGEIQLEEDITVSIPVSTFDAIKVYPNPVTSVLHVSKSYNGTLTILDLRGKIVLREENATQVSVDHLADGVYILKIESENGVYQTKIIKK